MKCRTPINVSETDNVSQLNQNDKTIRKFLLEDPSKVEQSAEFRNGFLHRRHRFTIVILGLIDAAL